MLDGEQIQPRSEPAHSAPAQQQSADRHARHVTVPDVPRLEVLVVMDDANGFAAVDDCLRYMSRYDTHTTLAGNLGAARFAISADDFDAILLDADLEGGRGLELLAEMQQMAVSSPCILISAQQTPRLQAAARENGATACLAKKQLTAKLLQDVLHSGLRGYPFP